MRLSLCLLLALWLPYSHAPAQPAYEILHLEPAFWWAGMKDSRLQLLVHGPDISALRPQLAYPGVRLAQVIRVENPNYLFLDLELDPTVAPGTFDIEFWSDGRKQQSYAYELLPRDPSAGQGYVASDVLYLITPDRFANGDPSNDQVAHLKEKPNRMLPGGRHGGDIQGIVNHLDYIADMGFSAIWLNPVLENDQARYSYHGYSTTDFYAVDARFGTNEAYQQMSALAKQKGIKLIMDMILNHCGSGHWWMDDLPTPDWINFGGTFRQTNHRHTTVQDPYAAAWDRKLFTDGWFVESMPDLNQRQPLLAKYLIQNSIWWIEYAGLAGIRMDTYPYPDMDFMSDWTCQVMNEYPNFNIVGEEWHVNPAVVSYWQRGKQNPNGYTSCLPGLMDFPLQEALRSSLVEEYQPWSDPWVKLYETLALDFLYPEPDNLVVFPDNHDMSRFFTQVGEDEARFRLGIIYLLTTRGIPQIFYGTEVLMKNPGTEDHGIIRSDFPGGWPGDKVNAVTGEGLSDAAREAQAFMRQLLLWRKSAPALHGGGLVHFAPQQGVYPYFRYTDGQKVMVLLNQADTARELSLETFSEMLLGHAEAKDVLSGQIYELNKGSITVPAKAGLILEIL